MQAAVVEQPPQQTRLDLGLPEPDDGHSQISVWTNGQTVFTTATTGYLIFPTSGRIEQTQIATNTLPQTPLQEANQIAVQHQEPAHNRIIVTNTQTVIVPFNQITTNTTGTAVYCGTGIATTYYIGGGTQCVFVNQNVTGNGIYIPSEDEIALSDDTRLNKWRKEQERSRSASIQRAKGSIKRALKLIDNMGFGNDIRMFLGGDEIVIYHEESIFKFVISRKSRDSIIGSTMTPGYSIPYKLQLFTKTDVHVADLCVYLKDTPLLDQVLAVVMYIRSGSEEDVLDKANWFNVNRSERLAALLAVENPKYARKMGFKATEHFQHELFDVNGTFLHESEYETGYFNNAIRGDIIIANGTIQ